jgi:putative transposase
VFHRILVQHESAERCQRRIKAARVLRSLTKAQSIVTPGMRALGAALARCATLIARTPVRGAITDLARSTPHLIAEHLLRRQHRGVLNRSATRPRCTAADRGRFVVLARQAPRWREALRIVKPPPVLRWQRDGFRLFWKWKSRTTSQESTIPTATISLIKELAPNNRVWGAERIRGAVLKVGLKVAKRTVQRAMRQARPPRPHGPTGGTLLRNHATNIWVCNVLHLHAGCFRPLVACFSTDRAFRRSVPVGVTRTPPRAWAAQQLRSATPFDAAPTDLIRDTDATYGCHVAAVAGGRGIAVLRTPGYSSGEAPRATAIGERVLGRVRRACLDQT